MAAFLIKENQLKTCSQYNLFNMLKFTCLASFAFCLCAGMALAAGPQLGQPGGRGLDKSGDRELQELIKDVAPKFEQLQYKNGDFAMQYNLYSPQNLEKDKKYPLVVFIADASTPGSDVKRPLEQGYGGLIWAAPQQQKDHPCFVLVPQFSGVAVNDAYERTGEVDKFIELLREVVKNHPIDASKLYITGQSMGGMIAMYYNVAYPGVFAASLFVDCHWDANTFDKLVEHPFIFVYAGNKGKAWRDGQAIENACRKMGYGYAWSEWSARLPLARQDELAATQLGKGQPVNLIGFENGTVLPEGGQGSGHMYAFDCAYRLQPLRNWLFNYSLEKPGL